MLRSTADDLDDPSHPCRQGVRCLGANGAFCETTHGARLPCRPFPRARPASAQSFSSANLAAAARWLAALAGSRRRSARQRSCGRNPSYQRPAGSENHGRQGRRRGRPDRCGLRRECRRRRREPRCSAQAPDCRRRGPGPPVYATAEIGGCPLGRARERPMPRRARATLRSAHPNVASRSTSGRHVREPHRNVPSAPMVGAALHRSASRAAMITG